MRKIFLKLDVERSGTSHTDLRSIMSAMNILGYLSYLGLTSLFRDDLPAKVISHMFANTDTNGDALIGNVTQMNGGRSQEFSH